MRNLMLLFLVLCLLAGCETPNERAKTQANLDKATDDADNAASENADGELRATSDDATVDAHAELKNAIARAKMEDKALLVHFSADW